LDVLAKAVKETLPQVQNAYGRLFNSQPAANQVSAAETILSEATQVQLQSQ
jgi:hypothetical protein